VSTFRLYFPAELDPEPVADLLRTWAAESRGGWLTPASPLVLEARLGRNEVSWWATLENERIGRLRRASERCLPGLRWEPAEAPADGYRRAIELRIDSPRRLLEVEHSAALAARLLRLAEGLALNESLLVQWQIGVRLPRPPIPPAQAKPAPRSIWNLPDWGRPVLDSEQVQAARKKQTSHLFAASARLAVTTEHPGRAHQLLGQALEAYQLVRDPGVGPSRRWLPSWLVCRRLPRRQVSRLNPPIRLSAEELAAVIGWPIGNPMLPGVRYSAAPRLPLDRRSLLRRAGAGSRVIGEASHPAQAGALAMLRPLDAARHVHLLGPTGSGKSTVLTHLIVSDLTAGRTVVAIDPRGDLVDDVLARLPQERQDRVVVLDPSDPAPVGFNPLTQHTLGVEAVLHVLRSIWPDTSAPRMDDILYSGLLTLGRSPGHSLVELPLLLSEPGFRRPLVAAAQANDPLGLGRFWAWYDQLTDNQRAEALGPVMRRLRSFLLRPPLMAVLGQASPRFDFGRVLAGEQSLLVKLPKGSLGFDGARLIGALLIGHLWRQVQRRTALAAQRRPPIFLYLDEFQDFMLLPIDLADAMAGARALGLYMHLAHQHLAQLDQPTRSAVLANAGSRVVWRLDYDDAQVIARRSGGRLTSDALAGLGAYEVYASLLVAGEATPYGSLTTRPLEPPTERVGHLLALNRQRWGVPATETEGHLRQLLEDVPLTDLPPGPIGGVRRRGEAP
jgi:hypothetical protein